MMTIGIIMSCAIRRKRWSNVIVNIASDVTILSQVSSENCARKKRRKSSASVRRRHDRTKSADKSNMKRASVGIKMRLKSS